MKERRKITINRHDAESIAAEERSWKCETCETMIEEHGDGRYCRRCADYWKDVQDGLFGY